MSLRSKNKKFISCAFRLQCPDGIGGLLVVSAYLGEKFLYLRTPSIPKGLGQLMAGLIESGEAQVLAHAFDGVGGAESFIVILGLQRGAEIRVAGVI